MQDDQQKPAGTQPMWGHFCVDGEWLMVAKGESCNWCECTEAEAQKGKPWTTSANTT